MIDCIIGHWWLNSVSSPFLLPGGRVYGGVAAESFNRLLTRLFFFWWPAPILKLYRGLQRVTRHLHKLGYGWKGHIFGNKRHSCHSGNSKGFRISVPQTWDKGKIQLYFSLYYRYFCSKTALHTIGPQLWIYLGKRVVTQYCVVYWMAGFCVVKRMNMFCFLGANGYLR